VGEPERPIRACVPVRLTCAEGTSILVLFQNGSLPQSPAAESAADKVRAALVATGFEPEVDIEIDCTEAEARFLDLGRLA